MLILCQVFSWPRFPPILQTASSHNGCFLAEQGFSFMRSFLSGWSPIQQANFVPTVLGLQLLEMKLFPFNSIVCSLVATTLWIICISCVNISPPTPTPTHVFWNWEHWRATPRHCQIPLRCLRHAVCKLKDVWIHLGRKQSSCLYLHLAGQWLFF